jgi:hypothetical protein
LQVDLDRQLPRGARSEMTFNSHVVAMSSSLYCTISMAPLPLPEYRRPTPAGYVAACLSKSFDLNVRTEWKSSTPQTVGVAYRLLVEFRDEYTTTLIEWVQRRRKPKFNPEMYNTIRALCKHTLSLEDQVRAVTLS